MARSFLSCTLALLAAALILLGSGATPAAAQAPSGSGDLAHSGTAADPMQSTDVKDALQLLFGSKHDYPGCIEALTKAGRTYPELPSPHVVLFRVLANVNRQDAAQAARAELEAAVKETPSDPEPYVFLAGIALNERRVTEAGLDLDKAKQLLENYKNVKRKDAIEQQVMSGIALLAESRQEPAGWKTAETILKKLLTIAPRDLGFHERLAKAQFELDNGKEAYKTLKAAKDIDRENARKPGGREVFLQPEAIMAKFYDQAEGRGPKAKNAKIWFDAALGQAPNDLAVRQVVGLWALETGDLAFAKVQAENALRIEAADAKLPLKEQRYPGSPVGHRLRGLVALWEKDWPGAERNFKAMIDDNPNDFVAKNNMALALCEQDDPDKQKKALAYAEGNYSANTKSPDAMSTLGWVHFRRNEFEPAAMFLKGAIDATGGKMSADTATYVAHIYYHQKQNWEAKDLLDKILKSDQPFSMRPEAQKLFEKVKDAKQPESATPAAPATPPAKTP
jgi:tetratricopeptide (TPR) repeat protein